jgi:hypothetical protein
VAGISGSSDRYPQQRLLVPHAAEDPGITDVCGDFTWLARAIPPALAALGALIVLLPRPRSIASWGAGAFGIALAATLAFATTHNAIPWGQLHCIID